MSAIKNYALLTILGIYFQTAFGIKCYRCESTNSSNPFQCNEFLRDDFDLNPESCDDVYGAQFCVKRVGRFAGGIGTKRECSSYNLGNYCDYVQQPGDKLEYRTCVYTCTGDGCNSATNSLPNQLIIAFTSIFLIFPLFLRR
ncbi:U-scoloptoxin(05)-Sm1a isoform X1 [Leptopilina heterotoma]|uniref:U-scoloptoxin(05)-Sm1a isoform X1 n=1 Tax=Leptopilina heterotoma TaxID=63436 RepID=UPI001CAA34A2|nr:U-scoloptoxin(05)-Sm1a isoform X1 [Leptopilina heterotoma]